MTDSDLDRIEQSVGITLPQEYREAIADPALVPDVEYGPGLCADADLLIRDNKNLRAHGFYGQKWDPRHFVIQNDGCGNYYFIKCPYDHTVYFADHEDNFDCRNLSNLRKWDSFYERRYSKS